MFITTNFSTEHCERAFKPCLFSITLIFECNDFTSKSNQQMKDKSHCHTFFFSIALYPWVFWFETSCPRTKTVCLYLSSRSLSLCHPSGTQGCVCETGVWEDLNYFTCAAFSQQLLLLDEVLKQISFPFLSFLVSFLPSLLPHFFPFFSFFNSLSSCLFSLIPSPPPNFPSPSLLFLLSYFSFPFLFFTSSFLPCSLHVSLPLFISFSTLPGLPCLVTNKLKYSHWAVYVCQSGSMQSTKMERPGREKSGFSRQEIYN